MTKAWVGIFLLSADNDRVGGGSLLRRCLARGVVLVLARPADEVAGVADPPARHRVLRRFSPGAKVDQHQFSGYDAYWPAFRQPLLRLGLSPKRITRRVGNTRSGQDNGP
jgi:hypothetical protein